MTCPRDWTYQNVLGALLARPTDEGRIDTVAHVWVELFGDNAERAVCDLAVALRALRDEAAFDPTVYSKVYEAIWRDVLASAAFVTFAAEFTGPEMTYAEVEEDAIHDLVWAIIERSAEVSDEAAAVTMAFQIMADEDERNHEED